MGIILKPIPYLYLRSKSQYGIFIFAFVSEIAFAYIFHWFLMAFYNTIRNDPSSVGFDPMTLGFDAQALCHLGHRGKVAGYRFILAYMLYLLPRICLGIYHQKPFTFCSHSEAPLWSFPFRVTHPPKLPLCCLATSLCNGFLPSFLPLGLAVRFKLDLRS